MEEIMLGNSNATANVATRDLETAAKFYEETLGLKRIGAQGDGLIVFQSGDTRINLYRSQYAGTNQATAVTWSVGDAIGAIVEELKGKGVTFEHYDMPGLKRDGDLYVDGDVKVAWFKDPDGNILNLINR
jgi:catechol 2,3-dioxygenase-like lactoylglutathione lyase family enzyme